MLVVRASFFHNSWAIQGTALWGSSREGMNVPHVVVVCSVSTSGTNSAFKRCDHTPPMGLNNRGKHAFQGTGFPYTERERLKLRGLLPGRQLTMEKQVTVRNPKHTSVSPSKSCFRLQLHVFEVVDSKQNIQSDFGFAFMVWDLHIKWRIRLVCTQGSKSLARK